MLRPLLRNCEVSEAPCSIYRIVLNNAHDANILTVYYRTTIEFFARDLLLY